jgi:hypothetical protein
MTKPLHIARADTVKLRYQVVSAESGEPQDITGMSFSFAVKERLEDTTYRIGPVSGVVEDAANGVFSFTLTAAETDQAPFSGLYEIVMTDGAGARTTLTPPGGQRFVLRENVID